MTTVSKDEQIDRSSASTILSNSRPIDLVFRSLEKVIHAPIVSRVRWEQRGAPGRIVNIHAFGFVAWVVFALVESLVGRNLREVWVQVTILLLLQILKSGVEVGLFWIIIPIAFVVSPAEQTIIVL